MRVFRTIFAISLSSLLLAACGGEEEATPATTAPGGGGEGTAPQIETVAGEAGEAAATMGEAARETMETFKTEYAAKVEAEATKTEALKAGARAVSDEQLSSLLGSLDEKLAAARGKLGEIATADEGAAAALKDEITALMGEIPRLYEQAKARFDEVKGTLVPETPGLPGGGSLPGGG